ncbi:hypothetical protein BJY04DRAFT_228630 [Aspergillus karnatakaensis]|uniref:DUF3176 domain-containing protein n=1 Tax=Aspergillus karnatakaensis TaxID=1810916 RepID=UPI003CCCEB3A
MDDFDADPSPPSTEYKRYPIYSRSEWLYEVGTTALSAAILAVIAYIFHHMSNKPLSDWDSPISLTATISILTTACSAALMHGVAEFISQLKWRHFRHGPQKLSHFETFDEASRGPWGSILFITGVRWNLATVGAFITIFRLSFAPLAQQVVEFVPRDVSAGDGNVTFGYSHTFQRYFENQAIPLRESIPQDPGMQSAVLQGLYAITSSALFSCPGMCQWTGSYVSLGFRSDCRDVTQDTLASQRCSGRTPIICNMTTPGGLDVTTRTVDTDYATSYYMNATTFKAFEDGTQIPDEFPEIARFGVYRSTPDYNFQQEHINVTECSLALTAYNFTGAIANGSEFSFHTTQEVDLGDGTLWQANASSNLYADILYISESTVNNTPRLVFGQADLAALQNFLVSGTVVTEWVEGNFENHNFGLAAALAGNADIPKQFERMATSMTNYMRDGPNAQFATGERIDTVTFVEIQWEYFLGPLAIEALVIVFAISTIFTNRKSRRTPLWKSSALAVLACHHDRQLDVLESKVKDIKVIKKTAEKASVRMQ